MIGIKLGLGILGLASAQNRLRQYTSPDGVDASLALDFTREVYGANLDASLQKYSVNGRAPGLLIDATEAQYGRQS